MTNSPLVTTGWLAEHLNDSDLRIVDIRGHVASPTDPLPHYFNHHDDYLKSHVPGAVFVDWVREITDPADPRHAKIAPPERFAQVMSHAGIGEDTFVVAYDDAQGMFAARLWWALNYYGHDDVAVLDGGWQKWVAEGRPLTTDIPHNIQGNFTARPQANWMRTVSEVLSIVSSKASPAVLVDARTPAEYAGQASRARRKGHIPGALSVPRTTLVSTDGTLLTPDQLRERFAGVGITDPSAEVVTYCNAGVSASFNLLALRIAGFPNSTNYDGSWKEWGNDEGNPIEGGQSA